MGVTLWLPKNRVTPYYEIPPEEDGDMPVLLIDHGSLDGHQQDEIRHKVHEDRERDRKIRKRYRPPRRVEIIRLMDKMTRKISGYFVRVTEI